MQYKLKCICIYMFSLLGINGCGGVLRVNLFITYYYAKKINPENNCFITILEVKSRTNIFETIPYEYGKNSFHRVCPIEMMQHTDHHYLFQQMFRSQ